MCTDFIIAPASNTEIVVAARSFDFAYDVKPTVCIHPLIYTNFFVLYTYIYSILDQVLLCR